MPSIARCTTCSPRRAWCVANQPPAWPAAPSSAPPAHVYTLATWSQRARAAAVDGALLLVPTLGLWAVALPPILGHYDSELAWSWDAYLADDNPAHEEQLASVVLEVAVWVLLAAVVSAWLLAGLYHAAYMASTGGRTPGKRAAGICVVRAGGEPVTLGWSLWRALIAQRLLWLLPLIGTLGAAQAVQYLWPLWDDQHRALHDFIARSRVVRDAERLP